MDETKIQVLIVARNNVNELERTFDSIWKQNFPKENIYVTIVDFGSTDGTYEKALSFDSYHLGVYQKKEQKNPHQMCAEASRITSFVWPSGKFCFAVLLNPGDVMYPDCLKKCSKAMIENYHLNPAMVICESDIELEDGNIIHQDPLFQTDTIIDGSKELSEYVRRGYTHHIFLMRYNFEQGRYKSNGENNEGRYWNKLARMNNERMAIYIKEPLVCEKPIFYEDELEEILYRWEAIISIIRFYTSKYGHGFDSQFEDTAKKNLAKYALWRSYILCKKEEEKKKIEDCFLISSVIDPAIKEDKEYQMMKDYIENGTRSHLDGWNNV